jgi:hypothetical protein
MATIATFGNGSYNPSYVSSSVNNGVTTETWNKFTVVKDSSGTITWNDIAGNYPEGNEPRKFNVTQTTSQPSITYGNGDSVNITNKNGWYLHSFTGTNTYLGYSIITIVPTGPTVTSITDDKIFVPSDTVTNTDFTLLKNGSAYANTNISVTLGNFDPVDQPRFYDYSLTYNGTALYSRTIDSKSFHDLYYDDSWTSSPTSGRSTNSSRILAVLGTLPITANFTVPTVVGQTIGTRTFHDLNRSMRVILTYPAGSTHTQFICYFHVSEINNEIKGKFQSHTLDVTVFDESPFFTIGAQQTMSHTFTINGSNITISVNDWVYSDEPEGNGYIAPVSTTSNGGGKPDRYPLIMTNLFNRNRSLYSIGMTHKDTWDLFL